MDGCEPGYKGEYCNTGMYNEKPALLIPKTNDNNLTKLELWAWIRTILRFYYQELHRYAFPKRCIVQYM